MSSRTRSCQTKMGRRFHGKRSVRRGSGERDVSGRGDGCSIGRGVAGEDQGEADEEEVQEGRRNWERIWVYLPS